MSTLNTYNSWWNQVLSGGVVDLNDGNFKVSLHTSSYTPNLAHDFYNDITNEVSGTNYTAGGKALTSVTVTGTSTTTVDAADVVWTGGAGGFTNARYAVFYYDTGTAATSPVYAYVDFTTDRSNVSGDFTIEFNPSGIFSIS